MKIAFAYVTDERGFELALHSAASVALTQAPGCDIHIFCHRFEPEQTSRLKPSFAGVGTHLTFHEIQDSAVEHYKTYGHVTTPALLKLSAVQRLAKRYDRVVYLDNDILVFGRLPIDEIRFGAMPLAAVVDMDVSDSGVHRQMHLNTPDPPTNNIRSYFNSGVLIFCSEKLADGRYAQRYREALESHASACCFKLSCTSTDQCALNTTFEQEWVHLPLSYNMQAGAKFTDDWQTALIRHYCGVRKFIPIAWFRNDARDIRLINRMGTLIGRAPQGVPALYEIMFKINALRKRRGDLPMQRFLQAVGPSDNVAAV